MATEIKLRRGTKAQHDDGSGFTGALGEVTVDTTDDTLRVHDGSLKGGHVIAKLSDVEASDTLAELLAKGNSTGSNDIQVDGTDKVTFGAESGGKLEIYEDDSQNGVIKQTGTGALKISGIYGTLNNDSDEELISWDTDNAGLSWRGASGAGLKLFTKETGIGVTGTVNASDGLTADYIDLTGGESTTTTGTIACKQIVLNDPTSTNDGDDGTDLARIYTESTITNRSSLVIHSADDGNDQIVLRTDNDVDVLVADSHGINVTGTVDCDGLKMDDGEYAQFGTANDLQIFHSGNHSYIKDRGTGILSIQSDGDSITFHDSANARDMAKFSVGGTASLNWAGGTGTGTKLATTATGINVTGTVTASDGLTADYIDLTGGESTTTTGTVACTTIKLADPSTPENDQHLIYTEADSVDSPLTNLVIHAGDDTHEKVILRVGNNNGGHIDALKATGSGVDIASSLDVTGTVTADGVNLADDKKLTMGTSDDFRIYKNASGNAIIHESGSGNLEIRGESGTLRNNANETCLGWNADKAYLYWQGDTGTKGERLKTTDSGIDVTGTVTCDEALTISSTGAAADAKPDIWLFNNAPAAVNERLGQITWYGKNDVSPEQETVNYAFQEVKTTNVGDSTEQAEMQFHIRNGASHVEVLTLDSSGIDVTGTVTADGVKLGDDEKAFFGAGNDLQIFHSGSDSFIKDAGAGILSIQTNGDFIALRDSEQSLDMAKFTTNGSAALNYTGATGAGTKLETTSTGIDVTGAVKSTKGFYTDYKNHGDFPTTDSWYTIAICKGRDAVTTIQRASGEFIVVDNTDAAGHETARFTASELFAQDALISVSEYLSYSATSINRFRIKSGNAFEGSALQVYASATTADLGVTLINDPYLQSNEGGWHLLDAPVIDSSDPSTLEGAGRTLGYAAGDDVNNRAWDWTNFTSKADTGFLNNPTGLTTTSGVSVGGDLEVTGATTVNGALIATNDYHQFISTSTGSGAMPLIEVFRDKAITNVASSVALGGFVFTGLNEDDRKVSYGSFYCAGTNSSDDGEHKASLVFTVADGSGAADPFTDYTDNSYRAGHKIALNIGADYFTTSGYIKSDIGELKLGGKQAILESPDASNDQSSYDLHMPNAAKAKVMSIGGIGPFDTFVSSNKSVAQMLQYRGQHMVASGGPFEFELPACVASTTISTSTANVGDIWQISNVFGSAITIDRDGSGTTQNVYYFPSLTLTAFTNNPTLAVGGTMMLQAVAVDTWMIFNPIGLTDA